MPLARDRAFPQERLGAFSAEEIVVRIEYKHCPNLSIVDTPGLLLGGSADDAAVVGGEGEGGGEDAARRRLQAAGVEQLVRSKIAGDEAIVLCVEESNNIVFSIKHVIFI